MTLHQSTNVHVWRFLAHWGCAHLSDCVSNDLLRSDRLQMLIACSSLRYVFSQTGRYGPTFSDYISCRIWKRFWFKIHETYLRSIPVRIFFRPLLRHYVSWPQCIIPLLVYMLNSLLWINKSSNFTHWMAIGTLNIIAFFLPLSNMLTFTLLYIKFSFQTKMSQWILLPYDQVEQWMHSWSCDSIAAPLVKA